MVRFQEEAAEGQGSSPGRRLRSKTAVRFIECSEHDEPEALARECLVKERYTRKALREVLSKLPKEAQTHKDRRGLTEDRFVFGAYCHGGLRGLTTNTKRFPLTTRFLNECMRVTLEAQGEGVSPTWTALLITRTSNVDAHKDFRNEWGSLNHVFAVPGAVELWRAPADGARPDTLEQPDWRSGLVDDLTAAAISFNARYPHAVRKHPDWVLVAYTPLGSAKLKEEDWGKLQTHGFRTPVQVKVVSQSSSSHEPPGKEQDEQEESDSSDFPPPVQGPLEADCQEDSYTPTIGWDVTRGPGEYPRRDLQNGDLFVYLRERFAEHELERLLQNGVEEPADLPFLYEKDLLEMGIPLQVVKRLHDGSVEIVPAKAVCTVKPGSPYKRKMRVVSCGNYATGTDEASLYAGGAGAESLRALLVHGGRRGRRCFGTDIKTAFLLAPIPAHVSRRYAVRPPRVLVELNICEHSEMWLIQKALYGFRESPKWWATHRDSILHKAQWCSGGEGFRLQQLRSEGNIWAIIADSGACAHLLIYVDDFLLVTEEHIAQDFVGWIRGRWECTDLSAATEGRPLKFLGVDVYEVRNEHGPVGFRLGQEGYVDELLRSHGIEASARATTPVPREWVREMPPAEQFSEADLRAAQRITGELLWVAQRTRLDLGFCVGLMSSWTTKAPQHVTRMGQRVLQFLAATKAQRLSLVPGKANGLSLYSDASFCSVRRPQYFWHPHSIRRGWHCLEVAQANVGDSKHGRGRVGGRV